MKHKTAIVIPCHDNLDVLKRSIPSAYSENCSMIVFDDGSNDGTYSWLKENYPRVHVIRGDGSNWWTGSTKKAIDYCIENDFEYILSLNADVLISPDSIIKLIECSRKNDDSIIASLVVDVDDPSKVIWSGSRFNKINKFIPIYTSKYYVKAGNTIKDVPNNIYEVDEVHGRGVLIPSSVIKKIGNYDSEVFPQYGGDTDFSFRAKKCGIRMFVNPEVRASVFVENTSIKVRKNITLIKKLSSISDYLTKRKNGEALYVWWNLYRRHLSFSYFFQSYLFVIGLNIYRRLKG
tara:strand:- start:1641 stop:2513 length:873 start_codon:yes stop_codon:yes gene_type:complete